MSEVNGKIEGLLADILQVKIETITDDLSMKNVEAWDSLKHMELIVSLEEKFGLQFSFEEIVSMQSVSEIKRVIDSKTNAG